MPALHTLTVQDMLWLNLTLTGRVHEFDYATLEEATFLQYGYGASTNLVGQAARFLAGFPGKAPFPAGNEACAFFGALAFLELNGKTLELGDEEATAWAQGVWASPGSASTAISAKLSPTEPEHHHGIGAPQSLLTELIARYPKTAEALASIPAPTLEPLGA